MSEFLRGVDITTFFSSLMTMQNTLTLFLCLISNQLRLLFSLKNVKDANDCTHFKY